MTIQMAPPICSFASINKQREMKGGGACFSLGFLTPTCLPAVYNHLGSPAGEGTKVPMFNLD